MKTASNSMQVIPETPYDLEALELERRLIANRYRAKLWKYFQSLKGVDMQHAAFYINKFDWQGMAGRLCRSWAEAEPIHQIKNELRNEMNQVTSRIIFARMS